ncbi:CHAT domain-containing protein [Actinoplanes octamycinicus]|uniref:CHAT domain-containing protein n=1 Tax=Actinoplanes octamycinicus TaxID=135948 RepID=UPI0023B260BD|nr:CHAT domain-containing protein [Actinoplanes octamycinicus]
MAGLLGVTPLTGPAATKSALRRDPPPTILHLATHGFVRAESDGPTQRVTAGLGLAGANTPDADGILSAEEITHLDLRGTRLVVASACETALGRIHDAEGAFGLHRSFAIAGAAAVVASLWNVPDRPTARLMTRFYRAYLRSGSAPEALAEAQREAAAQNRPATEWGAFICHGTP